MDDRGLRDAVPLEHRDGLARAVLGQLHRLAGRIDEPLLAGRPVGHLQRGVTERVGEGVAEAGRRRGLPQLDDEVRDAAAGHPGPEHHGQDRDRDRDLGHETRLFNGSSRDPERERGSTTPTAGGSRSAPAMTGTIWRRTGPLDRSQRRPRAMTRSTAPSEIRTRWIVSITWAAFSSGATASTFRPFSGT